MGMDQFIFEQRRTNEFLEQMLNKPGHPIGVVNGESPDSPPLRDRPSPAKDKVRAYFRDNENVKELSSRKIGEILKVDKNTVTTVRRELGL